MDAVGADQEVAFRFAGRPAGRIGEARKDLVAALLEAGELVAGDERLRTQPLGDRAASRISCSLPREIEICGQR